jgi:hypothetical protein
MFEKLAVTYRCSRCGRNKLTRPYTPHICRGQFRKHFPRKQNIQFTEVKKMGWNQGYTIFERTVIGAYDLGLLSKDLLHVLMEPYSVTDIDVGGKEFLKSKDGLFVEEIVLKVCGIDLPEQGRDDHPDKYIDAVYKMFRAISRDCFGWR